MAESSGRKKSKVKIPGIGLPQRCMEGLLHILDVNQHLHIRKMLTYNKKSTEKAKSPKVKQDVSTNELHISTDKDAVEANVPVEDKSDISVGNSGTVLAKSIHSKRRHSEHDVSKNLSQLSAQSLRRTVSIHHLAESDYINNAAPASEKPHVFHHLNESGSSTSREQIPLQPGVSDGHALQMPSELHETINIDEHGGQTKINNKLPDHLLEKHSILREKLNNAKERSKQKGTDGKELGQDAAFQQSKEFVDMMVLLNNNRDLLLKILKDPSTFVSFLESQQNSGDEQKSEPPMHVKEDLHSGTSSTKSDIDMGSIAGGKTSTQKSKSDGIDSESSEQKGQRENQWSKRNASARFKVIKKKIRDVVRDNRKERLRISMDGVLDKIPYGSKLFKDAKKEKKGVLERPATTRYDRENSTSKTMNRSHSLNESLDKYSQLLESVSESKKTPEKLKIKQEDSSGLQGAKPPKTLVRISSLPDLESKTSRSEVQHGTFDTVQSFKRSMAVDISDIGEHKQLDTYVHTMKSPEADALLRSAIRKDAIRKDASGATSCSKNQQMLIKDQGKCEAFDASKSLRAQDGIHCTLYEEDPSNWLTKTSAISELDFYFPESLVSPVELPVSESLEQKPGHIHFEELDSSISQKSQSDIDVSDELEGIIEDFERLRAHSEVDDYSSFFSVPVDLQNEDWFNYVRDILWKSGFGCNEFLRAWHSPNQPVDPLLFEESEWILDPATALHGPKEFLEHQLLFDLINEVLLEIYDTSSSSYPWLSRFDTRTRPLPGGYHALEEVWASISWYLDSQQRLDPTLDHAVARDFEKNDGWMDLQYDCEDVGLELEDIILDDLLDEVVLELGNLSDRRCVLR